MANRPKIAGVLLVLLVMIAMQTMSFASEHSHRHSTERCCTLCHAGPLPIMQAGVASAFVPLLSMTWLEGSHGLDEPHEVLLVSGSSRAPPR